MGTITNDDDPDGTYIQKESGEVAPYVSDSESERELIYPEEEHRAVVIRKSLHTTLKGKKYVPPPKTNQPIHLIMRKNYEKEQKAAGHCWTVSTKEDKPISKKFSVVSPASSLIDLLVLYRYNTNFHEHAEYLRKNHKPVHKKLKKTKARHQHRANKGLKQSKLMQLGEIAWILLKQRRFPHFRRNKLIPKAIGPLQIIIKYVDNSIKLKITEGFGKSPTFKARDLAPYLEDAELRTIPPKEGGNDAIWDGSIMTHMSNMDEELNQESYSSNVTDSATKEGDTRPKTTAQQSPSITSKHMTLQPLSRPTGRVIETMEDGFGILVLGTSYLSPRTLLHIIETPWKSRVKVAQSAASSQLANDQQTLVICAKASLDSWGTQGVGMESSHLELPAMIQ